MLVCHHNFQPGKETLGRLVSVISTAGKTLSCLWNNNAKMRPKARWRRIDASGLVEAWPRPARRGPRAWRTFLLLFSPEKREPRGVSAASKGQ